jgi:hypothetical protein
MGFHAAGDRDRLVNVAGGDMANNRILFILSIIVPILFVFAMPSEAFDKSAYIPSSMPQIINENKDVLLMEGVDYSISAALFKYRITVSFTKELREINADTKTLIEMWAKSLNRKPYADMYKHEFLVQIDGVDYWIPMQEQVLPYMGNELEIGDNFTLYIVLIGAVKGNWVFLATEFEAKQ